MPRKISIVNTKTNKSHKKKGFENYRGQLCNPLTNNVLFHEITKINTTAIFIGARPTKTL